MRFNEILSIYLQNIGFDASENEPSEISQNKGILNGSVMGHLRRHPDKFVNRFGARFAESEGAAIRTKLQDVISTINELKAED